MAALSLRLRFTSVTSRHNNITAVERGKNIARPQTANPHKSTGSADLSITHIHWGVTSYQIT